MLFRSITHNGAQVPPCRHADQWTLCFLLRHDGRSPRGSTEADQLPLRRVHSFAQAAGPSDLRLSCGARDRSEEHTSELQSLMRISYAVFCLKKKKKKSYEVKLRNNMTAINNDKNRDA